MAPPNLVHSRCGAGRSLSTHRTLLTRLQVRRKHVEGQKRAPLFKRRGDYTMLTKTIPALLSAAADANYGYPDGPSPDISSSVRTRAYATDSSRVQSWLFRFLVPGLSPNRQPNGADRYARNAEQQFRKFLVLDPVLWRCQCTYAAVALVR